MSLQITITELPSDPEESSPSSAEQVKGYRRGGQIGGIDFPPASQGPSEPGGGGQPVVGPTPSVPYTWGYGNPTGYQYAPWVGPSGQVTYLGSSGYPHAISINSGGRGANVPMMFGLAQAGGGDFRFQRPAETHTGGPIKGGSGKKDDVPLLAEGGEFVLKKPVSQAIGEPTLDKLNALAPKKATEVGKALAQILEHELPMPNKPPHVEKAIAAHKSGQGLVPAFIHPKLANDLHKFYGKSGHVMIHDEGEHGSLGHQMPDAQETPEELANG